MTTAPGRPPCCPGCGQAADRAEEITAHSVKHLTLVPVRVTWHKARLWCGQRRVRHGELRWGRAGRRPWRGSVLTNPTDCRRRAKVIARGWNLWGEPVAVSGTDLLARCVQHETDNLDGILFVDRLDPADREAALAEIATADSSGDLAPVVRLSPHSTPNPAG